MHRLFLLQPQRPSSVVVVFVRWIRTTSGGGAHTHNNNNNDSIKIVPTPTIISTAATGRPFDIVMKKNNNDPPKDPPPPPLSRQQPPDTIRRLIVQRNNKSENSDKNSPPRPISQPLYKRRPSSTETRDTAGHLILQQSTTAVNPRLNVAVWLDTVRYIKDSGKFHNTTASGTEAARRLLRGRAEWKTAVTKHVTRGKATEYELQHCGVPTQLWHYVLHYWQQQYYQVALPHALQLNLPNVETLGNVHKVALWELHVASSAANATVTEPWHASRALVRRVLTQNNDNNNNDNVAWTFSSSSITHRLPLPSHMAHLDSVTTPTTTAEQQPNNDDAMALYLTAVHRLASTLAVVLQDDNDNNNNNNSRRFRNKFTAGVVSRWHVVVAPINEPDSNVNDEPKVTVTWHGTRQVCIHLYGQAKQQKRAEEENHTGDNAQVNDTKNEEDAPLRPLRIVYQAQIHRPPSNTVE